MKYQSLQIDLTGTLELAEHLGDIPKRILQSQQRALVTLRRRLLTEAKRDIGAEYNLKAGRIADGLSIRNTADEIVLVGEARGVNASQFGAKWKRRWTGGARFHIKRGNPGGVVSAHADSFIGIAVNGAVLVFEHGGKVGGNRRLVAQTRMVGGKRFERTGYRQTKAHYLPNLGRLIGPDDVLRGVYGPSIGQMLKHGRRPERLAEFALRTLQSEQQRLLGPRA